jgi:hypothetical protein
MLAQGMVQPLEQARRWLTGVAGETATDLALDRPLGA